MKSIHAIFAVCFSFLLGCGGSPYTNLDERQDANGTSDASGGFLAHDASRSETGATGDSASDAADLDSDADAGFHLAFDGGVNLDTGSTSDTSASVPCGGNNQTCCANFTCNAGLGCSDLGTCSTCGGEGQPCCTDGDSGTCSSTNTCLSLEQGCTCGMPGTMCCFGQKTCIGPATTEPATCTPDGMCPGTLPACTPTMHANGVGQTWTDCNPQYTYNYFQAIAACQAYSATATCVMVTCGSDLAINAVVGSVSLTWDYDGLEKGQVISYSGNAAECPTPTNTGTAWN